MASVREEVDSFHRYAAARLSDEGPEPSFAELYLEWQDRHERESINRAIRAGIADVDAGRVYPARAAMEEIRKEFDLDDE